jgi:hypothetical protein
MVHRRTATRRARRLRRDRLHDRRSDHDVDARGHLSQRVAGLSNRRARRANG